MASFDEPQIIVHPRKLHWDNTCLTRQSELFLLGTDRTGQHIGADRRFLYTHILEGKLGVGGFHHNLMSIIHGSQVDYSNDNAILWRSLDSSIRGLSGSVVVTPTEEIGIWKVVGFQSHEVTAEVGLPQTLDALSANSTKIFWKIAYRPPRDLKTTYSAIAPGKVIRDMDVKIGRNQG